MLQLSNRSVTSRGCVSLGYFDAACECERSSRVGDEHMMQDVFVSTCDKKKPLRGVAYCVPPLYSMDDARWRRLAEDLAHHRDLGVAHTYIYLAECARPALNVTNATWLCMDWVASARLHSRGQNWQVNDCVKRSWHDGYAWALNKDFDERLVGLDLRALSPSFDAYTFERLTNGSAAVCSKPMCWKLRKHVAATDRVHVANIHRIGKCVGKCRVFNFPRAQVYLHHGPASTSYLGMPGVVYRPRRVPRA